MRISNPMITNRMLININKNMLKVNNSYTQVSTGKKVQYASEDPIIAARALKFRTNIKETEQFQNNTKQGLSWMEITEGGFESIDQIIKKTGELLVQGSTDTYTLDDRKKIATNVQSLMEQLGLEMNITYGGRYVFSGFRTDKPAVLNESTTDTYEIKQIFDIKDVQDTFSYAKKDNVTMPEINNIKIVKLPYTNANPVKVGGNTVTIKSSTDVNAYDISGATQPVYIKDTGELILDNTTLTNLTSGQINVQYTKVGIQKGELNPEVYFDCKNLTTGTSYTMNSQDIEYEFGTSTRIAVNSLSKDVYTDKMYADFKGFVDLVQKINTSDKDALIANFVGSGMSITDATEKATEQIKEEEQAIQGLLQDRFSDMISGLQAHNSKISTERADLGTRMSRLELIDNRLQEDNLSYNTLMSENEDIDYMEAIMSLNSAQSIYQASLQMGAKIIQVSLVNFIG